MREVWKFRLSLDDHHKVAMPECSQPIMFDMQDGEPTLWAIVDTSLSTVTQRFRLAGTGHPLGDEVGEYIGSCFDGSFVWHLFEESGP